MVMFNYASELRSLTLNLYDTETRPIIASKLVSKAIEAVGAETVRVLSALVHCQFGR